MRRLRSFGLLLVVSAMKRLVSVGLFPGQLKSRPGA
jgi:hypothetical protein